MLEEKSAWREIRTAWRQALGDSTYSVWVEPIELEGIDDQMLVLKAPEATEAWVRGRYAKILEQAVRTVLGPGAQLTFRQQSQRGERADLDEPDEMRHETRLGALNPRYTFDQFIIGDGNRLAHAAALAVAELPGQAYNPLFLHAPPGLGKTHLLHAIGNYVLAYGGGASVRYTTVEAFTNHFISSLNTRSLTRFKRAYRDVDVLLIDDVQFLARKAKTEEEFFHTFNALHETGRQLVLTCDRLPSELDGLAERLRERFQAGLVADVQPPDFNTRVAILRKRAALDGIQPAQAGVLELIAERVQDNVRALEGALIRVVAYHSLTRQDIDLELTQRVLDGMSYGQRRDAPGVRSGRSAKPGRAPAGARTLSIEAVKSAVAAYYGVSVDELVSSSRAARLAWPRQLAIHLARELTGAPLTTIGSAFGGRNHATVLHACKRVAQRASTDQQVAVDLDELMRSLRRQPS